MNRYANAGPKVKRVFATPGNIITVDQAGRDKFTVTYGLQVKAGLSYAAAAKELGECIFHNQACEGILDNS